MGELAEDNHENDEAGDPTPVFVRVDYLVAEKRHQERCCRDDDDSCISGEVIVHCVEQLCTNDHIDGRPANAGKDVEDRN